MQTTCKLLFMSLCFISYELFMKKASTEREWPLIYDYFLLYTRSGENFVGPKTIEELFYDYADDKNSMIAITSKEDVNLYEDFYQELDSWVIMENSMNMLYFGPTGSFLRMDAETILHVLINTKRHLIPISKVLLAWDIITDGRTAAFLPGRIYLAFGSLLNVIPEEELYYVNFGDPSVLRFFANTKISLNPRKYGVLAASYKRYFSNQWHRNGSFINDLGYLVCGFPPTDLNRIIPIVFREISPQTFNKLDICSVEQMQTLYGIATHRDAYGRPSRWSSHDVLKLNRLFTIIPAEDISSIRLEAVSSISPMVMKGMAQNKLIYFTKQQIMRMVPKTRRLYILRVQLKSSLDMNQLVKRSGYFCKSSILVTIVNLVTLVICR